MQTNDVDFVTPGKPALSTLRWRASFTAPGGQNVYFYWFDALDKHAADRIATAYAAQSLLAGWTMNLWCPEETS